MLLHFCLLVAQPDLSAVVLRPQVVEVAVFKPGIVYVAREAAVPAGTHLYTLDRIPQGFGGTLWYSASNGAQISELRTSLNLQAPGPKSDVTTISELLFANVGSNVRLTVKDGSAKASLSGKLLRFDPETGGVSILLGNGRLRSLPLSSIIEVDTTGLKTSVTRTSPKPEMRFRVNAGKAARVRFVTLEAGAAWVANYRLDVNGRRGHLQSMAELGLGSLALKNASVRLVTGLPNLRTGTGLDFVTGSSSLLAFLNGSSGFSFDGVRDPYDALSTESTERPMPDGLFRGGRPPSQFAGRNDALSAGLQLNDLPQFQIQSTNAARVEDLHTYDFGQVTLPAGGRIARILSETDAPLETVYRWQVQSTSDIGGFMRTLRVHNDSKTPWPAGSVFVLSDNLPLAQIGLPFTPVGQDASLVLGQAEDLLRTYELHEISREEVVPRPNVKTVAVTYEAILNVANTRDEPLEIEVVLEVAGQVTEDGGSKTIRFGIAGASNPQTRLTWRTTLAPGEKKTFTARYKENLM